MTFHDECVHGFLNVSVAASAYTEFVISNDPRTFAVEAVVGSADVHAAILRHWGLNANQLYARESHPDCHRVHIDAKLHRVRLSLTCCGCPLATCASSDGLSRTHTARCYAGDMVSRSMASVPR